MERPPNLLAPPENAQAPFEEVLDRTPPLLSPHWRRGEPAQPRSISSRSFQTLPHRADDMPFQDRHKQVEAEMIGEAHAGKP